MARLNAGFGQREMARVMGISVSYLNEIENGKRASPSQDFLENVRKVLEIEDEKYEDLAGLSRKGLPNDVFKYLFKKRLDGILYRE